MKTRRNKDVFFNSLERIKATITIEDSGNFTGRIYKRYGNSKAWHLVRRGTLETYKQAYHFITVYCDFS